MSRQGGTLTLVYIHSPEEDGADPSAASGGSSWRPGAASRFWLRCALEALSADLVSRYGRGAEVVFKRGPYQRALEEVRGGRPAASAYAWGGGGARWRAGAPGGGAASA
jgi:hypothetical protein